MCDNPTLKSCPFCGSEQYPCPEEIPYTGQLHECGSCYVISYGWNTRPIEDALKARIVELEKLVDELKPYRDGYDAYENPPEEGENVVANLGSWLFLAQHRGDKWYDSLGVQAEIRGGVERWWKLPEVTE